MNTFKTLLLREWMQHRVGWLLLALLLPAITLVLGAFGPAHWNVTGYSNPADLATAVKNLHTQVAVISAISVILPTAGLAWMALFAQAPGLPQRDSKDRSIEFWRALPVSDATALAATLCAHLVLMPLAVMLVATLAGVLLANVAVLKLFGTAGYAVLDLPYLGAVALSALPRLALGSLLASLWASALLLPLMAASAWLKRWGVPALAGAVGLAGLWLKESFDQTWLLDGVRDLFYNFGAALVPFVQQGMDKLVAGGVETPPALFWADAQQRLADLGTPLFGVALLLSATSFALLLLKRQRA